MDKHCSKCGRSIIQEIDFEEAAHRAVLERERMNTGRALRNGDAELVGVSANEYGLWSARFLIFTGTESYISEKPLNVAQM